MYCFPNFFFLSWGQTAIIAGGRGDNVLFSGNQGALVDSLIVYSQTLPFLPPEILMIQVNYNCFKTEKVYASMGDKKTSLIPVDRISELETETIRSQSHVARLEVELGRVLQQRDHLEDQLRRLGGGGLRKAGQEEGGEVGGGGGGIIHSVHILTGGENTKNSQSQNIVNRGGGGGGGSTNSYYHNQQQQHNYHNHHPTRLLSQSETNLAAAAAAVDGAINIEIRHNNNGGGSNSNGGGLENLSRSSGDLINSRFGGYALPTALKSGASVSVVNLPAAINNNSAGSSTEELYYGGESVGGGVFSRFGGSGAVAGSRYNNFLYPDRPRFFPQQSSHNNSTSRLAGFVSNNGRSTEGGGGQLQHLLSQERLIHNRSRSVENLFDQQAAASGGGLRYSAAASSEISLQPRPANYYGDPPATAATGIGLRSALSAVAVGSAGAAGGRSGHHHQQQQRMKATQSEQLLTKIGKLEKVGALFSF